MIHIVLAGVQHRPHTTAMTGMHMLEVGLLIGIVIGWFLPIWIRVVVGVFSFAMIGAAHAVTSHIHHSAKAIPYLLVAAAAIVVGLYYGRIRALRNLGDADYQGRLTTIRKISKWV